MEEKKKQFEVEEKFQPNEEQKSKLLEGATLLSSKEVVDDYYDTETFDFAKKGMWLRNRDGNWELKVYIGEAVANEITEQKEILEKLGYSSYSDFSQFRNDKLKLLAKILTMRNKYSKEGFILDFDETDFGLIKTDIETMVGSEAETVVAREKIIQFAHTFGMERADLPLKPVAYLQKMRPDIYSEILREADNNRELSKLK